jgi:uncharacterized repeat protein (TIGR01451 family)
MSNMNRSLSFRLLRFISRNRLLLLTLICIGSLALIQDSVGVVRAQAPAQADITVSKAADEAVPRGGNITYNLSVANIGPDAAANVMLVDQLPEHTTFVSASTSQGTVSFEDGLLTVNFGTIDGPDSEGNISTASATFVVSVNGDTPRGTTISNTASVASNAIDPDSGNNSASAFTVVLGPFAGDLLISEFRLRGPGGANDEFIELYNNIGTDHIVAATDGSAGYSLAASDGIARCTIPNGTRIPAGGHYLCVNSVGYSLAAYPSGNPPIVRGDAAASAKSLRPTSSKPLLRPAVSRGLPRPVAVEPSPFGTATGDALYTLDIPDNTGIALFSSSTTFTLANRFDAVGSAIEENTLYKEGDGYPAIASQGFEYAFVRDECGKSGSTTTLGLCSITTPKDTNDNGVDFFFVDTSGVSTAAAQRLGAPGPQNLSSPVQSNSTIAGFLLDASKSSSSPPNRVRDFTASPGNNSSNGTLDIRRRVFNTTDQNVVRLRFRVIDITTFPTPSGIADLRPLTSTSVLVTNVDDAGTCDPLPAPCGVMIRGTTLEQPPTQANGGGFNSSLSDDTVTLETPIAPGASVNVRFLLGVQQTGFFKFFVNIEALTAEPVFVPPPDDEPPVEELKPSKRLRPVKSFRSP